MEYFSTYFQLGFEHILEWEAMDHILFILSFSCIYTFMRLKETILMATAFTLGHTITLALATLKIIQVNIQWVEFIIPLTIFISAASNLRLGKKKLNAGQFHPSKYVILGVFGLVHGLGFSSYLQSLMGQEASISLPLFAFNIGLEIAQIIVISIALFISSLFIHFLNIKAKSFVLVVSGIIIGLSIPMLVDRFPGFLP